MTNVLWIRSSSIRIMFSVFILRNIKIITYDQFIFVEEKSIVIWTKLVLKMLAVVRINTFESLGYF